MTWAEAGKGLYSIALVVSMFTLAAVVARFAPALLRAIHRFSDSIDNGASAIRGATTNAETLARVETKLNQIHAAVCPERTPPP